MRRLTVRFFLLFSLFSSCFLLSAAADDLPFGHSVEVYRDDEGETMAFTVRLEQPFLAEEFEQSSFLRLRSSSEKAYLIYPQETKFQQKHAEFFGRLKGDGEVDLTLSYEIVSENLDGSRRVDTRTGTIKVKIPSKETGPRNIFLNWAKEQNNHFAELLKYYPDETFYQYCLLQSAARYGIARPNIPLRSNTTNQVDADLFRFFSGSQSIQTPLQIRSLSIGQSPGDLSEHISEISPPSIRHHDYGELLKQIEEDEKEPKPHDIANLIPADQYMIVFNSVGALSEALDVSFLWGEGVVRLFSLRAQDHQLSDKIQHQLMIRRAEMETMAADGAIGTLAVTGGDLFMLEGTDVSLIMDLKQPEIFDQAFSKWLGDTKNEHPDLATRSFNYRGHQIVAHYTTNRIVSSFWVRHKDFQIVSNSHRAIRRILDAAIGDNSNLAGQLDYQYMTTLQPPSDENADGYFYASKEFIQRQVGPTAKISEKRRLQCFNNLVMLNNASLFYRLEYGRSPEKLSDLTEGRFIDMKKTICPHGGAYSFDAKQDACTCSLHNRLRYLTPNQELSVLKVSKNESQQYSQYKQRYASFWKQWFNPVAVRFQTSPRVNIETCILPHLNGQTYRQFRSMVDKNPREFDVARIAPSAVASAVLTVGREGAGDYLRMIPGVDGALKVDPTLTDLNWLGDQVGIHFCDGETVLQIDPASLSETVPMLGQMNMSQQLAASGLVMATGMPVYATIDVNNKDKARRLLELMSKEIFLQESPAAVVSTQLDGYRLPDYKDHEIYVFSVQFHAAKLRLHVSLVGNQLVAATRPENLREVIDASEKEVPKSDTRGHMMARFNRRALKEMYDDLQIYWAEKSRLACHRNTILMYNLHKLYGTPMDQVPELAKVKYGIRPYCPDHGEYSMDEKADRCACSVHGNREFSRQEPRIDRKSSFSQFIETLDEVNLITRVDESAIYLKAEVVRSDESK